MQMLLMVHNQNRPTRKHSSIMQKAYSSSTTQNEALTICSVIVSMCVTKLCLNAGSKCDAYDQQFIK